MTRAPRTPRPLPACRDLFAPPDAADPAAAAPPEGRTIRRLLEARAAIDRGPPAELSYQHSVLCQIGLPYKPTSERAWERRQGAATLLVEAGRALDPRTGHFVELPLPHGEKPRLVLMHLNSEAIRTGSPEIDVEGSMTAFVRSLGIDTNGRNLRTLKEQLARLSAATIRLGLIEDGRAVQINTQVVYAFDLWFPKDECQRVLWPSTIKLGADYFDSLTRHAVPLDVRAIAALKGSALSLDLYTWLAQRLHRIPANRPQPITWPALRAQFGPHYGRLSHFRAEFLRVLAHVKSQYPAARVEAGRVGITLSNSPPPVSKRMVSVARAIEGPGA